MEVKIGDGRRDLYQWDTGQFLIIEGPEEIQEVHFCYSTDEVALICRVRQMDARSVVEVPNVLLQEEGVLHVYLYYRGEDGTVTKASKSVKVNARPRPADYVYTETEVWHYADLENRVNQLEAEGIAEAVNAYLKENPVEAGATKEEAAQIQQNREEIEKVSAKSSALEDTTAIVCAESGDVIVVRDSSDRPLRGLRLFGKTTQNGTPTPENPVELVSAGASGVIKTTVCGKNLYNAKKPSIYHHLAVNNEDTMSITDTGIKISYGAETAGDWRTFGVLLGTTEELAGKTITVSAQYVSSVISNKHVPYMMFVATDIEPCMDNTNISFKTGGYIGGNNMRLELLSGGKGNGTVTYTVTGKEERKYIIVSLYHSYGAAQSVGDWVEYSNIQVEIGSVVTPYEAYKEQTVTASIPNGLPGIPVASGGNYTDEKGQQWICDEIDFVKGVYVQRIGIIASYAGEAINGVYMSTTGEMTVGATVIYILAEPIETPLSAEELEAYAILHTNKPATTVYNDAGAGIGLEYVADTKNYIDQKLAAISAAMLNT